MKELILILLFILGAVFGSFACCQAWRLRYKAKGKKDLGERSVCLHCGYQLRWFDNIPIISWLLLRGKCRKCHKKIGAAEILAEVGLGTAFFMIGQSYLIPLVYYWDVLKTNPLVLVLKTAVFIIILVMLVLMCILSVYDAKWGELPTRLLYTIIILGFVVFGLKEVGLILSGPDFSLTANITDGIFGITGSSLFGVSSGGWSGALWGLVSMVAGATILAGTCFAIYKVSNERLMGGGDWLFALAIAFALGDWWLSLWVMFLSNLLGDIIMLPSLIQKGNHVIHFGPFLMIGFVIVLWLGNCLPALL